MLLSEMTLPVETEYIKLYSLFYKYLIFRIIFCQDGKMYNRLIVNLIYDPPVAIIKSFGYSSSTWRTFLPKESGVNGF